MRQNHQKSVKRHDATRPQQGWIKQLRPALRAALCAALCWWGTLATPNPLPALGDPTGNDFDLGTERKLGDEIMREIRADPDYLDDPVLLEYLQSLWQPLLAQARVRGHINADTDTRLAWEVFLIRERSVNAFALPGGHIGVHLGLMAMTTHADELASVLAHELSHVTQRHIARSIGNSKRQSLIGLAGLIVGVLAASRSADGQAANAVITGGQALAIQGQLNFSREMEREADRVGFAVMTGAGFSPAGMASMFEKLDQPSRLNDSGAFPYLRTHPLTTERIGQALAAQGTSSPAALPSSLEHSAAQARARVLMDPRAVALRPLQTANAPAPHIERLASAARAEQLAQHYSSALACTLLRNWACADVGLTHAQALAATRPGHDARAERAVALLQAQSWLARGQAAQAKLALQPYAQDDSRPVLLLAAQAALSDASGPPTAFVQNMKQSAAQLQTWVALRPMDSAAWGLLGQLEERLAQPLRALRAAAESRYALGDLAGATERLQTAQRRARTSTAPDFIEASVIDARLREIQQQLKVLQADERAAR
jgi:beta-barrel assembly-enhancing protease